MRWQEPVTESLAPRWEILMDETFMSLAQPALHPYSVPTPKFLRLQENTIMAISFKG